MFQPVYRRLPIFFLRERGRLYTGYSVQACFPFIPSLVQSNIFLIFIPVYPEKLDVTNSCLSQKTPKPALPETNKQTGKKMKSKNNGKIEPFWLFKEMKQVILTWFNRFAGESVWFQASSGKSDSANRPGNGAEKDTY